MKKGPNMINQTEAPAPEEIEMYQNQRGLSNF